MSTTTYLVFCLLLALGSTHTLPPRLNPRFRMTPDGPVPHISDNRVPVPQKNLSTPVHEAPMEKDDSTHEDQHNIILEELELLKNEYRGIKENVGNWMNDTYSRSVTSPIILGILAGIATMILLKLISCLLTLCTRRYYRRRPIANVRGLGDKDKLLDRHDLDSDEEI